jgi:radical SAM superfamily enzyme YgiQ (UPF0313 family)
MNILLVYPEMPDTIYAMRHALKQVGKKGSYPPLGLLTVASMLPKHWNKQVLDLNVRPIEDVHLAWADLIFLSAMNVQEDSVREVIVEANAANVPIVGGGSLFTHEYERFPGIEYFVLNEAEITLPKFLADWEAGTPRSIYETKEFSNMEESPVPAFDLVNMDDYMYSIIQYSRGCPYMCDFCDVTALFGRRPRVKTTDQVIAELEAIVKQVSGSSLVLFADDNLIGNKKLLKKELLPALIDWRKRTNPACYFATQLTINLADDEELMQMMIDAGFRNIFIGIETPDEASLKVSRKNQNLKRDIMDNIQLLHSKGFIIWGGFIVGFDTDDESTFQRQIDFLQMSGIPLPIVNVLKAPPGTELYDRMKRENRLNKEFAFAEGDTNIIPTMGERALLEGYLKVIDNIYKPDKVHQRLKRFFGSYAYPTNNLQVPKIFKLSDSWMALKILYRLGIKSPLRGYFWKLLFWILKNKPKYAEKALIYSLMTEQMYGTYKTIKAQVEQSLLEIEDREKRMTG